MNVAVIGGDFRSCLIAKELRSHNFDVSFFYSDPLLGGFLNGVDIWEHNFDLGPQYLDNFTIQDKKLVESFGNGCELSDLSFSYSGFIQGKLYKENMALPPWNLVFNEKELSLILKELLEVRNTGKNNKGNFNYSFHQLLHDQNGARLCEYLEKLCIKFYDASSKILDSNASEVIPFASKRHVLFDGETSNLLKTKFNFFDEILAAPKAFVSNTLFNYYPKYGYKKFFKSITDHLQKIGVKLYPNEMIKSFDLIDDHHISCLSNKNGIKTFEKVFISFDERIAEKVILNSNSLEEHTNHVPQFFVYVEAPFGSLGNRNYIFDYDLRHSITRITDLSYSNYSDKLTVLCAEVTAREDLKIMYKNSKREFFLKILKELEEVITSCTGKTIDLEGYSSHIVLSPKTYRLPKLGYNKAVNIVYEDIQDKFKGKLKLYEWKHTRKEMIDSIK